MVGTITRSTASGSTAVFSVPFPYLDRSHVQVRVAGVLKVVGTDFTWPTASTIQLVTGNPAAGTIVERRRVTPVDPLTVFQAGTLDSTDLNVSELQPLYVAQEVGDATADLAAQTWDSPSTTPGLPGTGKTITAGASGNLPKYDATGNIIDSGVNAQTLTDASDAAVASAAAAAASQSAAAASALGAATSASTAGGSATAAAGSATTASTQAGNASNSAAAAAASALAAASTLNGIRFTFDSSSQVDSDPGSGKLKLNNAAPASATVAYLDNVDADGNTVTGFLDMWDDGTSPSKGQLLLRSLANPAVYYIYGVTGAVVDGTGYRKVTLTYLAGSGALPTSAAGIVAIFSRTGDNGAGDTSGPASSVGDNVATFNGTTGKVLKDSGVGIASLVPKNNAAFTGTFGPPTNSIALNTLVDSAAVSLLGRSANSAGARADIAAAADDTILRRVASALGFGQLTAGMVPAGLVTYAMLASAAIASNSEFQLGTASKLLSAAALKSTVAYQALTSGTTVAWDMSLGHNASLALGTNATLSNPTNPVPLFGFTLKVTAVTSSRTLGISANYIVATGVEAFPLTIATTETVYVIGFVDTTSRLVITGVIRT